MTATTEQTYLGDLLKREYEPLYTRETVTILNGQNLALGAVLGKVTASGKYKAVLAGSADGDQTAAGVLLYPVDASAGDAKGVMLARGPAVVDRANLVFGAGEDGTEKAAHIAALLALGIVARTAV